MYKPKTFRELRKALHDKKSCREFLEQTRWNGQPTCPHCKHKSESHYKLTSNGVFDGLYKCRTCKKRFTITTGTMFQGSKIPLDKWFEAIHLILSYKKGISSIQLSKEIDVTQKTAWFVLTKIRLNLYDKDLTLLTGIVQADETYIGGKSKGRIWQNQGRSLKQKTAIAGVLTDSKVYAIVVPDTTSRTLKTIIYGLVEPGSTLVTDGWLGYYGLAKEYTHEVVQHTKGSYVNKRGYHTNGIEGFWSQLKRGITGVYHFVSKKYLQAYCNEFAYKYNTRRQGDIEKFMGFIVSDHNKIQNSWLLYYE